VLFKELTERFFQDMGIMFGKAEVIFDFYLGIGIETGTPGF
jgi:hypothetical protein